MHISAWNCKTCNMFKIVKMLKMLKIISGPLPDLRGRSTSIFVNFNILHILHVWACKQHVQDSKCFGPLPDPRGRPTSMFNMCKIWNNLNISNICAFCSICRVRPGPAKYAKCQKTHHWSSADLQGWPTSTLNRILLLSAVLERVRTFRFALVLRNKTTPGGICGRSGVASLEMATVGQARSFSLSVDSSDLLLNKDWPSSDTCFSKVKSRPLASTGPDR